MYVYSYKKIYKHSKELIIIIIILVAETWENWQTVVIFM